MSVVPTINVSLVRRLVAEQFPQWSHLDVCPVEADGWDNRSFRLGTSLSVRLPSAAGYAPQVAKEVRWLPHLAAAVSLPIPEVVGVGTPGDGYPFGWTVRRWIDGTALTSATPIDRRVLAGDLARFLSDLHRSEPAGPAGEHSAGRGAPLQQWDEQTRETVSSLAARIDVGRALGVWQDALDASASWTTPGVWFHGDIAPGNLLVRDGRLAAVIDFGLAGFGDPACDLAIAWTWFNADERRILRTVLGVDEGTWVRGQGWALWKALISLDDPRHASESEHVLSSLGVLRLDTMDGRI